MQSAKMDSEFSKLCTSENTRNITNLEEASSLILSTSSQLMHAIFILGPCFVGMIGNCAFLITVFHIPCMRTVTNAYLSGVSVADIMFLCWSAIRTSLILATRPLKNGGPIRKEFSCVVSDGFSYFCYLASLIQVTLVSMERFCAICLPIYHRRVSGRSRTKKLIFTSWILAFVFTAAMVPKFGRLDVECVKWPDDKFDDLPHKIWYCDSINDSILTNSYIIVMIVLLYGSMLTANIIMYVCILVTLSKRTKTNIAKNLGEKEAIKTRNQVARLLIINGVVFFLCQTPFRVLAVINQLRKFDIYVLTDENEYVITSFGSILIVLNSVSNPFIYILSCQSYRKAFWEALCGTHVQKTVVSDRHIERTFQSKQFDSQL